MSDEIIPFLSKQCMTQSGYDFAKAEARLIDHYLARVPALDTEMRVFTFAHEQHASGVLTSFKQKVKQTALAPEVSEAIKREIGSATRASAILEVMETVVSFLSATGGSFVSRLDQSVGEQFLSQYIKTVLLMDESVVNLGRAIVTNVQLKHVASLYEELTSMTNLDPLAKVHPKYKEPLAEDFKPRLGVFLDKLSEDEKGTLISVMSDWVSSRLDGNMSATGAIVDFLGYEVYDDNYLNQLSWFGLFPEDIPMAAFCDVFKALQEAG